MSIWFAILLGVGIIAAFTAAIRRSGARGIYVGIIESGPVIGYDGRDRDRLQVRAYVDESLVLELLAPSRLTGRMFLREADASVPLTFVRVPAYVSLNLQRSEWQERVDVPVLPVIFRFDPVPDFVVHAGQLVDVYIGEQ